jgi:enolase
MAEERSREQTLEYLEKHNLKEVLGNSLNELMESRPVDICGILARIMARRALPAVIERVVGREVLDSRGSPTVEVDIYGRYLEEVVFLGRAGAPSGMSIGQSEIKELRDVTQPRFGGRGCTGAAKQVNELLNPGLRGMEFGDLGAVDRRILEIDGTETRERTGVNAICAASFAFVKAASTVFKVELFEYLARQFYGDEETPKRFRIPTPYFNVLNGGKHGGCDIKIQEFMIVPRDDVPFPEQLRMATEVYHTLGAVLAHNFGVSSKNLGDSGGYSPANLKATDQILNVIEKAISASGYQIGRDIRLAIDAAAGTFYNPANKQYEIESGTHKTGDDLIEYWKALLAAHPALIAIEDPLDDRDYDGWVKLNAALGGSIQVAGDDLCSTSTKLIQSAIEAKWCNAVVLKVSQIGTITETFAAAKLAFEAGYRVIVSHRSGETADSVISDLAVAVGAHSIKAGAAARGECVQKYTRLLQIYEFLRDRDLLLR